MNKLKNELMASFDDEDIGELCEFENISDTCIGDLWKGAFGDSTYMLITGTSQQWNGTINVIPTVVEDTTIQSFLDLLKIDTLVIDIFSDHVVCKNIHKDGTNAYTIRPFNWSMLTKKQLWSIIKVNDLREDFMEWVDGALSLEPKSTYENFVEDVSDIDSFPIEFVNAHKNQNRSRRSK